MNRSRLAWIMSSCWHWPQYISRSGLAIIFNNLFDLYLNHYRRISQCWHLKDSLEVSGWLHSWFCLLERDSVWCGRILCLAGDCSQTSWTEEHTQREASALTSWYPGPDCVCPGRVSFSSQWTSWWLMRRSQHWAMALPCPACTPSSVCLVTLPSLTLLSERSRTLDLSFVFGQHNHLFLFCSNKKSNDVFVWVPP